MAGEIRHEWQGTTLIITSDSGTSGCDLKGDKGDMGVRGAQGACGRKGDPAFGDVVNLDFDANSEHAQSGTAVNQAIKTRASAIVATAEGASLTLTDSADYPMQELKLYVKAAQGGTGEPTPTNIRPITHKESIYIDIMDGNGLPSQYVPITLPETSCFGYVDYMRKKYVQTHKPLVIKGTENWVTWGTFSSGTKRSVKLAVKDIYTNSTYTEIFDGCCSHYKNSYHGATYGGYADLIVSACKDALLLCICDKRFATVDEYKAYFAEQYAAGTPVTVIYKLATPVEHDLELLDEIATLYPTTVLNTDGENLAISYVADTKNYIDKRLNELATAIVANT